MDAHPTHTDGSHDDEFSSPAELNRLTHDWVENDYNTSFHSGIQMRPIDRYNIDRNRVKFLVDDAFSAEMFFVEEDRKVGKTNTFLIHSKRYECPVDLREKTVQIRYDRQCRETFVVYFDGQRMDDATPLDLYANAIQRAPLPDRIPHPQPGDAP